MDGLKAKAREIINRFFEIDWYAVRIIPQGADDPLPALSNVVEITDADVDRAIAEWDELMPAYAGMLEAEIINQRDFDNG